MATMKWKRLALVGVLVVAWLAVAGLVSDESPAGSALALGFTSTPTFTPEAPTATPAPPTATPVPPTATPVPPTPTTVPTVAPQPTQPPPQPTQPPVPQPTATPVAAPSKTVPKTGSGLLGVALAGVLVLLLFGARRVRTSSR